MLSTALSRHGIECLTNILAAFDSGSTKRSKHHSVLNAQGDARNPFLREKHVNNIF
jgi:hypothetical protein